MAEARMRVDGVDYSPEGIGLLRRDLIEMRGQAMEQLPESAGFIVAISHVIALLADYAEMRRAEDNG